jgi:hypothetical protein
MSGLTLMHSTPSIVLVSFSGRHQLGQQQLDRVRWPLAQPLRDGFPVALGGGFDLLPLLGTKPGGNPCMIE